ncbi:TetR/AcrR family transcriptional regulator [Kineococcus indalonis]|uniref:TetR/AcrR family transcriptional regulator n=1 Tax=Kineococcus indalonis TaxID=2696566 RepID=UPI001411B55B|nr:TetR/AcrR family transcriptional regulator [Kineococcus indalonis]NAZ86359.1 TetR family transcriptional regulator [Kineococcus indalonis]
MITVVRQKEPVRDRLVEAASELFYAAGLRAVSVDKVIERAETTKVTFYRHFKSKDDLVVAYLQTSAERERQGVQAALAASAGDVPGALESLGELIGSAACRPGFRGCAFINAAAEYPDAASGPRRVVDAHRAWCRSAFEELVAPLGLPDAAAVAQDLLLLRDGAMVAGYLDDPDGVSASFWRSAKAVVGVR